MDNAADTVDKSSFFDFVFGDSSNDKKDVTVTNVKKNVKIDVNKFSRDPVDVNRFSTDPVAEGEAIKKTVGQAIGSFSGFFRQNNATQETVTEEK